MKIKDAVEGFLSSLKLRTESEETIRGYTNMLNNDFIPFMEKKYNGMVYVDEINITDIEAYLKYRKDTKGDANVSVNRNLYILRSLYKYMVSRSLVDKNIVIDIDPLKVKQVERDTLSLDDVDLEKKMIQVVDGKGGKDRKIPVAETLLPELKKYIDEDRPDVDTDNFFALEKSGSLSPQYVNRILKETTKKLKWDKYITAHNLRHSLATNLIRNGANVKEVGKILGHTDLRTTSIYLHANDQELTDTIALLG